MGKPWPFPIGVEGEPLMVGEVRLLSTACERSCCVSVSSLVLAGVSSCGVMVGMFSFCKAVSIVLNHSSLSELWVKKKIWQHVFNMDWPRKHIHIDDCGDEFKFKNSAPSCWSGLWKWIAMVIYMFTDMYNVTNDMLKTTNFKKRVVISLSRRKLLCLKLY